MKPRKVLAGIGALALAATSVAAGATLAAPSAQAVSATIDYNCQIVDNVVASAAGVFTGISLNVVVTPASTTVGNTQKIELQLGGDGTTASGPAVFKNGPFPAVAGAYQAIMVVSIDGGPLTNIWSQTPTPAVAGGANLYPNGLSAAWTKPGGFAEGSHTVELQGIIFDSTGSSIAGNPWAANGEPTNLSAGRSFDTICSKSASDPAGNGGAGPPTGTTAPTLPPANQLGVGETTFTVTAATGDDPQSTKTVITATPASPQKAGTAVTFTATVSPAAVSGTGTPAGTVQFKVDGAASGAAQTLSAGKATLTTSSLAVGARSILADYVSSDDQGADGFLDSSSDAFPYTIQAATSPTPTPTPTPTQTGPSTEPRKASATLKNIYCETFSRISTPTSPSVTPYTNWPVTITVTPGAAAPGSAIEVAVSLNASSKNGPATTLDPGQYRFEANVQFQGKAVQLTNGPSNKGSVGPNQPLFPASQLPTVAKGVITLPDTEGEYPVSLNGITYNNVIGSTATPGLTDVFDTRCNASNQPNLSPKSFGTPSVKVLSSNEAPETDPEEIENNAGGTGGGDDSGGVLPETGAKELLVLGILGLIALQAGAIVAVRAHRSTPRVRQF